MEGSRLDSNEKSDFQSLNDQRPELACIRGIWDKRDEPCPEWKEAINQLEILKEFDSSVPKFTKKDDCEAFVAEHSTYPTNPDERHMSHIFSMLVTQNQIQKYLIAKRNEYLKTDFTSTDVDSIHTKKDIETNIFNEEKCIQDSLNLRFDNEMHKDIHPESTISTLNYLFDHMKCGIYVMIRQGKVRMFVPFANKDYRNNWDFSHIRFMNAKNFAEYQENKIGHYRRENYLHNMATWWANGNILCNEQNKRGELPTYFGDHLLAPLKDMLEVLCATRDIPDVEFFINKRDYPQLKANATEPYDFLYRHGNAPKLPEHRVRARMAPIFSFYCSDNFADVPLPECSDWEAATGLVFPSSMCPEHCRKCNCGYPRHTKRCLNNWKCLCQPKNNYHGFKGARDLFTEENFKKFECSWEEKSNTAFFRGSATGGGVTVETNQRLHLASISYDVHQQGETWLDAKITGWNLRDKLLIDGPISHVNKKAFPFEGGKQNFVPVYEQSKYKYLIYVEGHCAANRYGFLMRLGSVILKVESRCEAKDMWYFPLLQDETTEKPDHVSVKPDLSDLQEKVEWCIANDDKCREIAANALELWEKYISKEGILDYLQMSMHKIGERQAALCSPFISTPNEAQVQLPANIMRRTIQKAVDREQRDNNGNGRFRGGRSSMHGGRQQFHRNEPYNNNRGGYRGRGGSYRGAYRGNRGNRGGFRHSNPNYNHQHQQSGRFEDKSKGVWGNF